MAAHTFAPEDALPPPKSAIIYSRDGRKRSLNIDMTKHFASSIHDHSMLPPLSYASSSANASTGVKGSTSNRSNGILPSVNSSHKKKKKKRTKKRTLERIEESEHRTGAPNGTSQEHHTNCQHHHASSHDHRHHHHHDDEEEDDEDFYSDEDAYDPEASNLASSAATSGAGRQDRQGIVATASAATNNDSTVSGSSKKKKKKRKKSSTTGAIPTTTNSSNQHTHNHDHVNSSRSAVPSGHRNGHDHSSMVKHMHDTHTQNDGFWHYSDAEERQRIREFWFQLREEERRSLVRVEKEAVLKKMKEQQRHSCSCSLCGRKRTAIEEELELLYDAYYDELEQYANQQQPSDGHALTYSQHSPAFDVDDLSDESRPSDEEDEDEDEDDEDDEDDDEDGYEDDDEEDEYEDEVSSRKAPFPYRSGFPNTLQAKGNILTVAEDLLENDGKKFLEMMDRLADRKVQRDDDLMDNRGVYEEYDDEEDGDFEDDGPEEDTLTKEQRMEEGRRMFQAFAARMFEQRVLSAYREKVAQERQERLLAELEEESRQEQLREERKEREKEKKRDKKRLQRQQKEEERAAKEALRLAEEKRQLEERERKLEADRKRREEERRIKEEEKRLRDEEKRLREEERLKKEEERKRKLKEEKAREAEKERKRKEELLAKEKEEQERKAEEAKRLDREMYLKQRLVEEQRRQEELRQQEQLAKEELLRQEQELEKNLEQEQKQEPGAVMPTTDSHQNQVQESVPASTMHDRIVTTGSEVSSASQGVNSQSPIMTTSTSPYHAPGSMNSQIPSPQGSSTPVSNSLWSNPYSTQATLQSQFQHQHPPPHQQQIFAQSMQPGMFRPPGHFSQIGGEHDAFGIRIGASAGRGGFLSGSSHQNQLPFPTMSPHQQPSNQLPQQIGGLRSPGLAPIGYGQTNVPTKKLLTIMDPNNAASAHDLAINPGSPLHSPSTLGAIGTPVNSFGPISPIGHTRRTSTPHGSVSAEMIKPIQRPVPIGRPKDHSQHGTISSSFDGLTLGLTGLTIGAELERKPRSPSLNLTGGSSLDQDSAILGKDVLRPTNGGDGPGNGFSNEVVSQTASLQALSPNGRDQRENLFFTGSFFGNRTNNHDPFVHSTDFSSYGQQLQQGHRSIPNSSRFMSPFPMPHPSSPHNQQQQHHPSQQQQHLFMQQQQYLQELQMQQQMQQQQQQQLGLGSPTISGSSSWGRSSFMRPSHLNSHPSNVSTSIGVTSPPSRSLSPPPPPAMSLQNSSHGHMMPIGPPSGGLSNQLHQQHQHSHQRQQQQHQFNPFPNNGLGLTVGSGRKSFSHLPPMRHSNSIDGSASGMDGGLLSSGSRNHVGQAMENDRLANGFPSGYGSLPPQQHQQPHQQHPLGAIGDVVNTGAASSGGTAASGGSRDTTFSL
ncbi:Stress response protein nst1 [Haplosporangium sp. Z 767]|nr:Stress response protein nst1 [Haplosporangium sp. Z 767]